MLREGSKVTTAKVDCTFLYVHAILPQSVYMLQIDVIHSIIGNYSFMVLWHVPIILALPRLWNYLNPGI